MTISLRGQPARTSHDLKTLNRVRLPHQVPDRYRSGSRLRAAGYTTSIFRWSLRAIDHEDVHRTGRRFHLQSELLLHRGEE